MDFIGLVFDISLLKTSFLLKKVCENSSELVLSYLLLLIWACIVNNSGKFGIFSSILIDSLLLWDSNPCLYAPG